MPDILVVVLFLWLFVGAVRLALRVAWGTTKIIATVLFILAFPMLAVCLLFVGGFSLLVPVAMVGLAFGLLRASI